MAVRIGAAAAAGAPPPRCGAVLGAQPLGVREAPIREDADDQLLVGAHRLPAHHAQAAEEVREHLVVVVGWAGGWVGQQTSREEEWW